MNTSLAITQNIVTVKCSEICSTVSEEYKIVSVDNVRNIKISD